MAYQPESIEELAEKAKKDTASFGKYTPTIFVACGGTGAKVFERVRRLTLERFGGLGQSDLPGVAYVSLDTDTGSQKAGHQQEEKKDKIDALISYRKEERLDLDGSRIKYYVDSVQSLQSHPHIAEWFDPALIAAVKGTNVSEGAGQIRPIARLVAFENREHIINVVKNAYSTVTSVREEQDSRVVTGGQVRVILCGSFAGGTGAGIFLDVAAMLKDQFRQSILLTGVFALPGVFEKNDGESKLKANGYACLAELNYYASEPYRVRWSSSGEVVEVKELFDKVYLIDSRNESKQTITSAKDVFDIIGDTLFMDFFQGDFAATRRSVQVNRAQTLLQTMSYMQTLEPPRWRIKRDGAGTINEVERGAFRQGFLSFGMSRYAVASWRILNRMSYMLAKNLVESIDSREDLVRDEYELKREFAQKLGIFQGTAKDGDGQSQQQRQIETALMENPSQGAGVQSKLADMVIEHFTELTIDEARDQWWEERSTGMQLAARWRVMQDRWAGAFDDASKGEYVKRIQVNRELLYRRVKTNLQEVIEQSCEKPDIGPHRVSLIVSSLCASIVNDGEYWVKEMEARAEQARLEADRCQSDWDKMKAQAAEADTSLIARIKKSPWQRQLEQAQAAAVGHWQAVANRKMYLEAAGFMREVRQFLLLEGVEKQEMVAKRLTEVRAEFEKFEAEYAMSRQSAILQEEEGTLSLEQLKATFLGDTAEKQKESLKKLFEKTKARLGVKTNKDLRERLESDQVGFMRDMRWACWLALKGEGGKTDWFGEVRDGLIESTSVLDVLERKFGSAQDGRIKELALNMYKKAVPWVDHFDAAKVDGLVRDVYVIRPKSEPRNKAYADAFLAGVRTAANSPNTNVVEVQGSDRSEIAIYVEVAGLIPASFSSMHGQSGMHQSFRALSATRQTNNVKAFLHLDKDIVKFPRLVPMEPDEARRHADAWKWLLTGVLLGVVKTRRNDDRVDSLEQCLHPKFAFDYDSGGAVLAKELGQAQSAVESLAGNPTLNSQLVTMVNRQIVNQSAEKYKRLLALVQYYKLAVFPIRLAEAGVQDRQRASLAYWALDQMEQEFLTQLSQSLGSPQPEVITELVNGDIADLVWRLSEFAEHAGRDDDSSALVRGWLDELYAEKPRDPPHSVKLVGDGSVRSKLRRVAYDLLPASHRHNDALAEQNKLYPWLRLAPRYELFLPSKHPGVAADANDPRRRDRCVEYSVVEAVSHFLESPADTHLKAGAKWWYVRSGSTRGEYLGWDSVPRLKDEYLRRGGVIDTSAPLPPPPAPGGTVLMYSGPSVPAPAMLPLAKIAEALTAFPAGPHYVLVNQQWVDAATHPEVQRASSSGGGSIMYAGPAAPAGALLPFPQVAAHVTAAPSAAHHVLVNNQWTDARLHPEVSRLLVAVPPVVPPPPTLTGMVPPPPPGLGGSGAAVPPPPPGPMGLPPAPPAPARAEVPIPNTTYLYVGGKHNTWTQLAAAQIVQLVVGLPPGSEGHVAVDNQPVPVMQVPELQAAILSRRG